MTNDRRFDEIPEIDFTRPGAADFDDIRQMSMDMAETDEDVSDWPTFIDNVRWDEISNRAAVAYAERLKMFDPLLGLKS
jgi:hypothetical protein